MKKELDHSVCEVAGGQVVMVMVQGIVVFVM